MKLQSAAAAAHFIGTTLVVLALVTNGKAQRYHPTNIRESLGDIIQGLGSEIIREIPTPEELLYTSIQVLVGLPEQTVSSIINRACKLREV